MELMGFRAMCKSLMQWYLYVNSKFDLASMRPGRTQGAETYVCVHVRVIAYVCPGGRHAHPSLCQTQPRSEL